MGITETQYDAVIAERDQARREVFELKSQLQIAELDLARALRDVGVYRRNWNNATAELKRMMDRACRRKKPAGKRGR
jgi:hypothetical protein